MVVVDSGGGVVVVGGAVVVGVLGGATTRALVSLFLCVARALSGGESSFDDQGPDRGGVPMMTAKGV